MRGGTEAEDHSVAEASTLVNQGEPGTDVHLILDGIFVVEVDGEQVAELGPGAVVGVSRRASSTASGPGERSGRRPRHGWPAPADALDAERLDSSRGQHRERSS